MSYCIKCDVVTQELEEGLCWSCMEERVHLTKQELDSEARYGYYMDRRGIRFHNRMEFYINNNPDLLIWNHKDHAWGEASLPF